MKTIQNNEPQKNVSRGEFLRGLGLSSAALMAFYCMGTLTSCTSNKADDPTPNPNPNPNPNPGSTTVDFTVDLTAELKANGDFIYKGNVIVIRAKNGSFIALSKVCTHEGTTVDYRKINDDILCPNHGSGFSLTGAVTTGPATLPLKVYKTELKNSNTQLRVFE